ncbi:MAG: HdeD family acid-resistance protein [Luteibaculaceae bacterium]
MSKINNQTTLRGLALAVVGLAAFIFPQSGLVSLLQWIAIIASAFGILNLVAAYRNFKEENEKWKYQIPVGLLDVIVAALIFSNLDQAISWLVNLLGVLAVILGVSLFFVAKSAQNYKPIVIANGSISLAFAGLIFFHKYLGIDNINQLIYFYLVLFGFVLAYYGIKKENPKTQESEDVN